MNPLKCPVCGSYDLIEGERVDVGFGGGDYGIKCGPDHCEYCGYIEQGPDPSDYTIEYYIDCWKRGLKPGHELPTLKHGKVPDKYIEWIVSNVKESYGKCREVCKNMVHTFPNLRRVYGMYYCFTWGCRSHFWCIDEENLIIDPTKDQFPSKGCGIYEIKRFYPLKFDDVNI